MQIKLSRDYNEDCSSRTTKESRPAADITLFCAHVQFGKLAFCCNTVCHCYRFNYRELPSLPKKRSHLFASIISTEYKTKIILLSDINLIFAKYTKVAIK